MLVTQLTVVNACLASMGEEPINSLAEENSFVNSAKFALENATVNVESEGWWFNKEQITLLPDTDGLYRVPADVIDLDINSNPAWLTMRGQKLYSVVDGDYLKGTRSYQANIIRLVTFEDVPFHAKRLIKAAAVLLFQQSYDGDATKIKEAETEYGLAYQLAKSQHIRSVKANFGTAASRQTKMLGGHIRLGRHR